MLGRQKTQFLALVVCGVLLALPVARGQSSAPTRAVAPSKEAAKRARKAFSQAQQAEREEDWEAAFALWSEAAELVPGNGEYLMKRETARFRLVQEHMDRAERAAVAGRLEEARTALRAALALDPSYDVAQERLQQLQPPVTQHPEEPAYASRPVEVKPQPGTRSFDYRGEPRRAYEEVARQFGLIAAFDEDLRPQQIRFRVADVDFWTAMRVLGRQTSTFWRALDEHTFLVAPDNPQKRQQFEPSVVRTVTLSNLATPEQMTEMVRLVREIAGVRRTQLDTRTRTLTMRDSPESIALAARLIDNLEQAVGEIMLEVEILDVNRNAAQQLGITPPTSARTFTVSPQDVREAQQSPQALLQVLQRVFGTPTTFTGQSSLGALIPPLIAFGGGKSIFFATLPGAAAAFADTFSILREGRRLLLRAQDGQPATFFVGDRFPVAVAVLQPNLVSPLAAAITQGSFPRSDLTAAEGPISIVAANLAANLNRGVRVDLAVANASVATIASSNGAVRSANVVTITTASAHSLSTGQTVTISGVSDSSFNGTFTVSTVPSTTTFTYAQTGPDASSGGGTVSAGSVSIFLGNGDGTFGARADIPVGVSPSSIAVADFNVAAIASSNGAVRSADVVTITTTSAHGLSAGQSVTIGGVTDRSFNGTFTISTVPSTTIFTYVQIGADASSGGGTVADGRPDLAVANASVATIASSNGAVRSADVVTITTASAHGLSAGQSVTISGVTDSSFNGTFTISTVPSTTIFTYAQTGPDASSGGGTVSAGSVSIFLGNGDGTFGARADIPVGVSPSSIAVADFNADGRPDLAVANEGSNTVSILLGNGDGTFSQGAVLDTGTAPRAVVAGDFNGDGRMDLVVANSGSNAVSVFLGNGDGTFASRTDPCRSPSQLSMPCATGSAPVAIAVADFNGDNQADLAIVNHDSNSVSLLLGNGDGTFRTRTDFTVGDGPAAVVTGDFNADGHTDLITANGKANTVTVLLGAGDGSFGLRADLNTGNGPAALAAADFNGDGRLDLAIANHDANTVSVILNQTPILPSNTAVASLSQIPYPGFQYEDLGVKVRATPRLHPNNEVTLQLQFEIRSLSGQSLNRIPVLSNRTVEETVRLRENETTLLTGILQRTEQLAISGWPGLASTPGLGPLISSRNPQKQESELLILITPRRIRLARRVDQSFYAGRER